EIKNEKEITSLLKKASKETIPKHLNLLRKHQGNTKGSKSIKEKLEASLMGKSENWKKLFKGNFVLKKFSENVDVDKKELTETILKEMKRDGYIPAPVEKIIGRIH
ncbi:MAG: hypothetical protein QGG48_02785, partial [Desulfatiglandales bacterium]|nr:hypothetical protein [Desulfatiglandales bacterium]